MRVHEALDQLSEIRRLVVRAATYRGFRSSTTFLTAGFAIAAMIVQNMIATDGRQDPIAYLLIWCTCAAISGGVLLGSALARLGRVRSVVENELAMSVVETLTPSLVIGALVTLAAAWQRHDLIPWLPAWWMILMSIGIFALRRSVGRAVILPAAFYGIGGLLSLVISHPLSAFWMGGVFGTGQTIAAIALRITLERSRDYAAEHAHGS